MHSTNDGVKPGLKRRSAQDGIDAAALGDYIKRNRPEFAAEVDEVLAEIEQYAESVKAEPAQSPDDFAAQAELERRVQARLRGEPAPAPKAEKSPAERADAGQQTIEA